MVTNEGIVVTRNKQAGSNRYKVIDRSTVRACGQFWFDRAGLGKASFLGAMKIIVFCKDFDLNF